MLVGLRVFRSYGFGAWDVKTSFALCWEDKVQDVAFLTLAAQSLQIRAISLVDWAFHAVCGAEFRSYPRPSLLKPC